MVELKQHQYQSEDTISLFFKNELISKYEQLQVEIFDTCSSNPKSVLGFGTSPSQIDKSVYTVSCSSKSLKTGIYEIKLIKLHSPNSEGVEPEINYVGGSDFPRLFFEVNSGEIEEKKALQLSKVVEDWEKKHNEDFNKGIIISNTKGKSAFSVFALVKGLKIGIKYRLDKYEFIPLPFGLRALDNLNATNRFLEEMTRVNFIFEYSRQVDEHSQQKDSVTVAHFPKIICDNLEEAHEFCEKRVNSFLASMSLIRGSVGEIFDFVITDLSNGNGTRLTPKVPYIGNLLTGGLAGEQPEALSNYIRSIETNSFHSFLVVLHKEALKESNDDYKILRYWSILEILAESKNYSIDKRHTELQDYNGKPLFQIENGQKVYDEKKGEPKVIKEKNAIVIVYNLFKEQRWGKAYERLEKIRTWIALRDAVAHFGSFQNYTRLQNAKARGYAENAVREMNQSKGHNPISWELKEDVKLILMRELNKNAM